MPPHHRRTHRRPYIRRHFTESSKIITWNATTSPTDTPTALYPSAFHREFQIITWNATTSPTDTPTALYLSAFHREFENNYLKCHHITDGHTDGFISVSTLSAGQFYRQNSRRTAQISKGCALNASLTTSYCRQIYRRTTKNMEGHWKNWCEIQNLPTDF